MFARAVIAALALTLAPPALAQSDERAEFLSGKGKKCVGCDLKSLDFKEKDQIGRAHV